jgi:glycosyl transferase/beta-hydroxylase protein BlmF
VTDAVFFVATAHPEYAEREFPAGSVVIDPWRMVKDQPGVTVRRLGENKPALISILVPTRGRPSGFARMVETALYTALHPSRLEVVVWVDEDDPQLLPYWALAAGSPQIVTLKGARRLLSECWNECATAARGEILMHCGDDLTFETNGWDQMVRDAFAAVPDRIAFVYGDDLSPNFPDLGTHGFVHRRWVETVGYFVPPLFSSDWNDVWLTEVAQMIDRARPLPKMVTEHHHWSFGKADRDQTHVEREERGERDGVVELFKRTRPDRERDAEKLRAVMS